MCLRVDGTNALCNERKLFISSVFGCIHHMTVKILVTLNKLFFFHWIPLLNLFFVVGGDLDVWSAGCVLAELLLGQPIFPGASGVDQLVEIIKVLGTPTREQIKEMNPHYTEFKFPQIKPHPWSKVKLNKMTFFAFHAQCKQLNQSSI